jgi:hypothetical protein
MGWNRLGELGMSSFNCPNNTAPDDDDERGVVGRMKIEWKTEVLGKTCLSATWPTTNPT